MVSKSLAIYEPGRLADVLSLIQVLALHGYRHRSEKGVFADLVGSPISGSDWESIALDHPEFFRVDTEEKLGLSLVARHVLPKDDQGRRELPSGMLGTLLETAITLHDRQVEEAYRWKVYVPVIAEVFTLLGALITAFAKSCKMNQPAVLYSILSSLLAVPCCIPSKTWL